MIFAISFIVCSTFFDAANFCLENIFNQSLLLGETVGNVNDQSRIEERWLGASNKNVL